MDTLQERWQAYCLRKDLSIDAMAYGLSLIESASDRMKERAAATVESWGAIAPAHQQQALAAAIRELTAD